MNWNSFFHSGSFRGWLCALLIAAILLGLWLPGTGLKAAEPENPLPDEGIREISVLKLGESVRQTSSAEPADGGQTNLSRADGPAAETRPEDAQKEPEKSMDNTGSDGQEDGDQGADGGDISPADLSMTLIWQSEDAGTQSVVCGADKTQAVSVLSYQLGDEGLFRFSVKLTGNFAEDAEIKSGVYTSDFDPEATKLDVPTGTLMLKADSLTKKGNYHLTFTVRIQEKDVLFHYDVTYRQVPDVKLSFIWRDSGRNSHTLSCDPLGSVSGRVKNNQLHGGRLDYELKLTGADKDAAQIKSVVYSSDTPGESGLKMTSPLRMTMPADAASNTYRITVNVIAGKQTLSYEIILHYGYDVRLQLQYTVLEDGQPVTKQIDCENTKTATVDTPVRDNQLENGILNYEISFVGSDSGSVEIESVTLFRSGDGKEKRLGASKSGQVQLLPKDGKTGENTFTVKAKDDEGNEYSFKINIRYKPMGIDNIEITTNLDNVTKIPNESGTNLTVQARSEEAGYLAATGTDTILRVVFDGEEMKNPAGQDTWEYDLYPANPEVGDENTHTLYIYAEDAYGNYGEKTLTFTGYRVEAGQVIGTASIYVDMTALGLGVVGPISYEVLADEPVSYVVAKAIMGMDTGEPFGAASDTLGWRGSYSGTLDRGFYLQSLNTGYTADALEGNNWPGTTEDEVLEAIDARFGKGTGLATLWRCLYRNGLNKSAGSGGTFGEFDYTSGSGWMFSVGGETYYPGQSMSAIYLRDGDVLTLRFTLAYGWDVGGGSAGYGSTVGYCVRAINGSFRISHRWETVEGPDGTTYQVCHCCGLAEDCAHENTVYRDLKDGTHILFCEDCQTAIGDPEAHSWTHDSSDPGENHTCVLCGASEAHRWQEVEDTNTATCTEPGTRTVRCAVCGAEKEEEISAKGHTLDNRWNYTATEHYQKCSTCGEEVNRSAHQYVYDEEWSDYVCTVCNALHDFDTECSGTLTIREATCQKILYYCDGCGNELTRYGSFEEYHDYEDGVCRYCGAEDPNYTPHDHDYQAAERGEPTCTEAGYILYTCSCGESYTETLPATGHSWSAWTVVSEPTAEEAGERTRYCEVCGETETETLDPTGDDVQMYFLLRLFRVFL